MAEIFDVRGAPGLVTAAPADPMRCPCGALAEFDPHDVANCPCGVRIYRYDDETCVIYPFGWVRPCR